MTHLKQFKAGAKAWVIKTSASQWAALFDRWVDNVIASKTLSSSASAGTSSAEEWSELVKEDAKEWWTSHLPSDAVRMAA